MDLTDKIPIRDIKEVLSGKTCVHSRESKSRKSASDFSFCLVTHSDPENGLHFVTPDEKTFCYWIDALNALLGHEMVSREARKDAETLHSMLLAVKLLDLEGVSLPTQPPSLPPPPPTYDFAYKY